LPLYFYAASAAIAAVTTPITNAFNAVGKITTTTKLMIMWTVLTWIFYPALSIKYGYVGTAIAALIVGISSFYVWYLANQMFKVNIFSTIKIPLLTSIFMLITTLSINLLALPLLTTFILKIVIGSIVYLGLNYILSRQQISWFVDQLKCLLVKKSV
jgi:O-antigen/teichoic acid export membrane protein